jgi:predicted PurR-regulated permease PerM
LILLLPTLKRALKRFASFLKHNAATVISVIVAICITLFVARGGGSSVVKNVISVMQESARIRDRDLRKLDDQYKKEVEALTAAGRNSVETVIEANRKHEEEMKRIESEKTEIISDLSAGDPKEITSRLASLADAKNGDV